MTTAQKINGRLPTAFQVVPPPGTSEFASWAQLLTSPESGELRGPVTPGLVRSIVPADPPSGRTWFAVVPPAPYQREIAALGWIDATPASGLSRQDIAARAAPKDDRMLAGSWAFEQSVHQVGVKLAVVVHQHQGVDAATGRMLVERCGVFMLDEDSDLAVTLELLAFDLRTFEDIVTTSLQILENIDFPEKNI